MTLRAGSSNFFSALGASGAFEVDDLTEALALEAVEALEPARVEVDDLADA